MPRRVGLVGLQRVPNVDAIHRQRPGALHGRTGQPGGIYMICHPSADASILEACTANGQTHQYLSNGDDGWCLSKGSGLTDLSLIDCTHEGI